MVKGLDSNLAVPNITFLLVEESKVIFTSLLFSTATTSWSPLHSFLQIYWPLGSQFSEAQKAAIARGGEEVSFILNKFAWAIYNVILNLEVNSIVFSVTF